MIFASKNVSRETKSIYFARYLRIFTIFSVFILGMVFLMYGRAYDVYVGERYVATVRDRHSFDAADEAARSEIEHIIGTESIASEAVAKQRFFRFGKEDASIYKLSVLLKDQYGRQETDAYRIYVDGRPVATGKDRQNIEGCISKTEELCIKVSVLGGGERCIGIANDILIKPCVSAVNEIMSGEELLEVFGYNELKRELDAFMEKEYYSDEETYTPTLAMSGRMRNGPLESDGNTGVFTYEKCHTETVEEEIPYEVEKIYTHELSEGVVEIKSDGVKGRKLVSYTVYTEGDEETKRSVNAEVTVSAPANCVMYVGTYVKEEGDGYPEKYGRFLTPCKGIKTSGFGMRELFDCTSLHKGCDIAAPDGTDIFASCGGTVVYAGENGNGYGIHVIIEHSDGFKTLYAHMRSTTVKTGQKVCAGSKIGEVGLTGNTTGYHLHFEIISDGICVNPEDYIRI